MNAEEMECFCRDHAIKLLIDAAHPFAQVLHQTIEKVSKCLQIPVIRYERRYPPRDEDLILLDRKPDFLGGSPASRPTTKIPPAPIYGTKWYAIANKGGAGQGCSRH